MDIGVHVLGSGQKELGGSKQDRSGFDAEDCLPRNSKLARTMTSAEKKDFFLSPASPVMSSASLRRQEQMLSFSDKSEASNGLDKSYLSPFLHQIPPSYFKGSGGYGSGGMMMNMSMQGNFTGVKEPFTLSQWAELEIQALIYKYITANVPVPSSLLISVKKSFYPYGSLSPASFGWGAFHLGFPGSNMEPEPGRCRRTDGKKWRCSREAVPDQKYCERHINRGRHRSRKLVEVESGHTTIAAGTSKEVKTLQKLAVASGSNRNNACASSNRSLSIGGQNINPSSVSLPKTRVGNQQEASVYPCSVSLQPRESAVIHQKHRNNSNPFEFGHIYSDSSKAYGSSFLDISSNQEKHSDNQNPWQEDLKS